MEVAGQQFGAAHESYTSPGLATTSRTHVWKVAPWAPEKRQRPQPSDRPFDTPSKERATGARALFTV